MVASNFISAPQCGIHVKTAANGKIYEVGFEVEGSPAGCNLKHVQISVPEATGIQFQEATLVPNQWMSCASQSKVSKPYLGTMIVAKYTEAD